MKNLLGKICLLVAAAIFLAACNTPAGNSSAGVEQTQSKLVKIEGDQPTYLLPSPITDGKVSVESTFANRRSQRYYMDQAISAEQLGQILWAAYGVTSPQPDRPTTRGGFRTPPSAGGRYPLELHAVIGKVDGIEPGVYRYISEEHKIVRTIDRDIREELCTVALGQTFVKEAPVTIFYSGIFERTTERYNERGLRYVWIDLGHSAENLLLQTEALGLGACVIGSFYDDQATALMMLPEGETPMYIVTVGHKRAQDQ